MKRIILLATCCIVVLNLHAQRATDEPPRGLKDSFRTLSQNRVVLTAPDMAQTAREDRENDQKQGLLRYAVSINVTFSTIFL
jgi:hypothetical protein